MEIGNQTVGNAETVARRGENIGIAPPCFQTACTRYNACPPAWPGLTVFQNETIDMMPRIPADTPQFRTVSYFLTAAALLAVLHFHFLPLLLSVS